MAGTRRGLAGQLPLGLGLGAGRGFDNFEPGGNREAVVTLGQVLAEPRGGPVYLWGAPGSGKTHLLEACCGAVAARGERLAYVPLRDPRMGPGMLAGLAGIALVAVDDLDAVAGDPAWEEALFHLYNQSEQSGGALVLSAARSFRQVSWGLPDLASRLAACVVSRLRILDDLARGRALKLRARERGFELSDEVLAYVLARQPRDMHSLMALLDRLDRASLSAQRRITLPFVKILLETPDP